MLHDVHDKAMTEKVMVCKIQALTSCWLPLVMCRSRATQDVSFVLKSDPKPEKAVQDVASPPLQPKRGDAADTSGLRDCRSKSKQQRVQVVVVVVVDHLSV